MATAGYKAGAMGDTADVGGAKGRGAGFQPPLLVYQQGCRRSSPVPLGSQERLTPQWQIVIDGETQQQACIFNVHACHDMIPYGIMMSWLPWEWIVVCTPLPIDHPLHLSNLRPGFMGSLIYSILLNLS